MAFQISDRTPTRADPSFPSSLWEASHSVWEAEVLTKRFAYVRENDNRHGTASCQAAASFGLIFCVAVARAIEKGGWGNSDCLLSPSFWLGIHQDACLLFTLKLGCPNLSSLFEGSLLSGAIALGRFPKPSIARFCRINLETFEASRTGSR